MDIPEISTHTDKVSNLVLTISTPAQDYSIGFEQVNAESTQVVATPNSNLAQTCFEDLNEIENEATKQTTQTTTNKSGYIATQEL